MRKYLGAGFPHSSAGQWILQINNGFQAGAQALALIFPMIESVSKGCYLATMTAMAISARGTIAFVTAPTCNHFQLLAARHSPPRSLEECGVPLIVSIMASSADSPRTLSQSSRAPEAAKPALPHRRHVPINGWPGPFGDVRST